jgi:hypothetical protein
MLRAVGRRVPGVARVLGHDLAIAIVPPTISWRRPGLRASRSMPKPSASIAAQYLAEDVLAGHAAPFAHEIAQVHKQFAGLAHAVLGCLLHACA